MASTSTGSSLAKRLTWVEPKGYRKAELKGSWKSVARMAAAAAVVAAVVVCVAVWVDLGFAAARGTVMAAGAIVVALLAVWGLSHLTRITVKVTNRAIVWHLGDFSTAYRFAAIDHCEIDDAQPGGGVPTLAVVLKNGDKEVFGVAPSVSPDILRAALEQRGVNVTGRLGAST